MQQMVAKTTLDLVHISDNIATYALDIEQWMYTVNVPIVIILTAYDRTVKITIEKDA